MIMERLVITLRADQKIFVPVIGRITVDVMHNFACLKWAPYGALCDDAMLKATFVETSANANVSVVACSFIATPR